MPIYILSMVKAMEDHKTELIIILAGYKTEMDTFLQTNPGLRSRFPIHIDFPDYSTEELLQIANRMCGQRQYTLSSDAERLLIRRLYAPDQQIDCFGNARTVRNIIEKAMRRQAVRLFEQKEITRDDLMRIEPDDLMEVSECANS